MLNRQVGNTAEYLTKTEIDARGLFTNELGAIFEFQNDKTGAFENPFCNDNGIQLKLLQTSKVAIVYSVFVSSYPNTDYLGLDFMIEDLVRTLPSEAITDNISDNISVSINSNGYTDLVADIRLEYAFPIEFSDRQIINLIKKCTTPNQVEVSQIINTPLVENGYDTAHPNKYTFTLINKFSDAPDELSDIHCSAFTYKEACQKISDLLKGAIDESKFNIKFYNSTPTQEQLDKFDAITFTKYTSAKHLQEIIILPNSGFVIDEMGYITNPQDFNGHNSVHMSKFTNPNPPEFFQNFSNKDKNILSQRIQNDIEANKGNVTSVTSDSWVIPKTKSFKNNT